MAHRSPTLVFSLGLLLFASLAIAPSLVAVAQEDVSPDEAKKRLEATQQQLRSSRAQEEGLAQDVAALAAERARLNRELIEAGRPRAGERSKAFGDRVQARRAHRPGHRHSSNSITERKETIVKMLSAMQRMGRTPPPALVTRRDDALAVVRSAMLLADVFPELKYQADNLSHELEGLVTLENGIREQRDAEKGETDRLAEERGRADQLLEEKKTKLAQSEAQLGPSAHCGRAAGGHGDGAERADHKARTNRSPRPRSLNTTPRWPPSRRSGPASSSRRWPLRPMRTWSRSSRTRPRSLLPAPTG